MIGSWAIQSVLTKGKALSEGQCSRKSLQSAFFLHADGVEFQTRDSPIMLELGLPFQPAAQLVPATFCCVLFQKAALWIAHGAHLMARIKWSLEAMQDGLHPVVFNKPLPKGSVRDKLQAQQRAARNETTRCFPTS